jgi:hypothetical protein
MLVKTRHPGHRHAAWHGSATALQQLARAWAAAHELGVLILAKQTQCGGIDAFR